MLGLQLASNVAFGAIMESGLRQVFVTVAAYGEGSASLYTSRGGGGIGGRDRPELNTAAKEMVAIANELLPQMQGATDQPLPNPGETVFYALTDGGIYGARATDVDLRSTGHTFNPLYRAGHQIITLYRLMATKKP